ncbi:MAG: assimilatory sulfite reductase (NADPH) flavoprotein subunit [Verrucomicrobia subdivision 3 bacterium]|nr:assimilatory sulfite reductase (NADPH) flavoprotein subunit [Limisphaerales bacterium]
METETETVQRTTEPPYVPKEAPFNETQRAWLNGYLVGAFSKPESNNGAVASEAVALETLTILWGSQSGSAEGLAKRMGKAAAGFGFGARVLSMEDFAKVDFAKETRVMLMTSTWGDGDPPDNALAFWEHLNSAGAPSLKGVRFSVLALGDSNYEDFCGAGKMFDRRFEELGAKRIHPRVDCDVDYDEPAAEWTKAVWAALGGNVVGRESEGEAVPAVDEAVPFTRKNPFPAKLLVNRNLNGEGSAKETRHFEISLEGSGLEYSAGDALGVFPTNCPELVDEILTALGSDGEDAVLLPNGGEAPLRKALIEHYSITEPAKKFLKAIAVRAADADLAKRLMPAHQAELAEFLWGREVIDLLLAYPNADFSPTEFVGLLKKLQPRLYSIASSPKAHPGEVHLTVATVRYESHGRARKGVCSTFLADRAADAALPVFAHISKNFRLPDDGDIPIIMVGPGTGIAPFRAFLEERQATGAKGDNWLFFGDQHVATDFLYQNELETFQRDGLLTHLHTAFSRDGAEKIYVQNRMREHAAELWAWLQDGAHFYVCGDAKRMAKDVDAALHDIAQTAGGKSPAEAKTFVDELKKTKRYQRDVY